MRRSLLGRGQLLSSFRQISRMQVASAFAGATVRPAVARRPSRVPVTPKAVLEKPVTQDAAKTAVPVTPKVGITLPSRSSGSSAPDSSTAASPLMFIVDESPIQAAKPGQLDDAVFQQHWSVAYWRARNSAEPDALQKVMRMVAESIGGAGVFSTPSAAAYWSYHVGRSSFFVLQAALGLLSTTNVTKLLQPGGRDGVAWLRNGAVTYALTEALAMYYQDFKNIQEGKYKLPWDMTSPQHRQYNPLYVARSMANFLREASSNFQRQREGKPEDVWLQSNMYPAYYLNTFHYQTDGWLSSKSARVYENSTETLFVGRQDAMQRQTLVPVQDHLSSRGNPRGTGLKTLELACGTGRFATFIKDNFPDMEVTAQDLSPYYLAEARSNAEHWRDVRQPGADLGGYKGTGFNFLQAAAEAIPAADNTFDVVTCVYLFHELPEDARKAVVAEMARVVKPGGLVVLTDSIQLGDRPIVDVNLGRFSALNEPYYENYIHTDLGQLFVENGLTPGMKLLGSSSKTLSFTKRQ